MPPTLQLRLLGEFSLHANGQRIDLALGSRGQALLAYLALHPAAPQPRQHLAFLFWPDATEGQARNNLRQALYQLRRAWPAADQFLAAGANTLGWQPAAVIAVDVAAFEQALAHAAAAESRADWPQTRRQLEQALDLYQGDLLSGYYDEWLQPERARLHQAYRSALTRLQQILEAARDYAGAVTRTEQLLRLDPLNEDACASLMRLHALNHDRASALRVYRDSAALLLKELGVEPGPALRDAHARLLQSESLPAVEAQPWSTAWPLIGRQEAWTRLQAAWRRAAGGQAGFVLVSGEAGIGKSRLAEELLVWAGRQGLATARTRAYAAEGRLAYGPVAEWLRSPPVRAGRAHWPRPWLTDVARLLPELLVEQPDLPPPAPLTEYWQRQRFFETLARVVLAVSQPLLLVFDDLQWCDPETLEWLHYLLRSDPQARLLVLGTARAEDIAAPHPLSALLLDLQGLGRLTAISLTPLDAAETSTLAAHAAGHALAAAAADHLFRETEGNPLFVVETVRATLGRDAASLVPPTTSATSAGLPGTRPLPPRVHGVIAARLRQLSPPAGELAGLAATIGRAFSLDALALAAGVHENDLARGLDELWQRRIIREQGAGLYDFSHDKLREVAYAEVSPPLRRLLHRRVAQSLETAHAADLQPVSGQIAAHYEHAGLPAQAIPYYQVAAAVAQRIFANDEAASLLRKALVLLADLPESSERAAAELALQTALGATLVASQGYDSREALAAYNQATHLCAVLRQPVSAPILRALAIASIGRGRFLEAHAYGSQVRALADHADDGVLAVEAYYLHGVTWFWQGNFSASRAHLEEALARYQPESAHVHLAQYSQDPQIICLIRLAFSLWCLGYPDQALQKGSEALTLAQALAHPMTLGYVRFWLALLGSHRGDLSATLEHAQAVIALHHQVGVPFWEPFAIVLRGWALAKGGELQAGWGDVRAGLAALRQAERELFGPYFLALQADLHAQSGDTELALACLAEAHAAVLHKAEHWCQVELYRLQGEVLHQRGAHAAAEAAWLQGLHLARQQHARLFELRLAVRLAQHWRGRPAEARAVLAEVYGSFTEGLALPELAAARALLSLL